ncbi:discoidin domain-containing protein [Butyrivibrio sp. MC2013]|uniref:discoidin domain-containing protein n=1 Tax=Butyrivibrio sp. MC2013 TaxID=1280686 RepID=UPI0004051FCF|nr:discoidin domain-containing protein [Butyrivibrio sp. MC2013]
MGERKNKNLLAGLLAAVLVATSALGYGSIASNAAEPVTDLEEALQLDIAEFGSDLDDKALEEIESEASNADEQSEDAVMVDADEQDVIASVGAETAADSENVVKDADEEDALDAAGSESAENAANGEKAQDVSETAVGAKAENAGVEAVKLMANDDSSIRILMVGNSLTRYNDVAGKLTKLFELGGVSAHIDTRTQMGASLFDQADILKESSRDAVVNGNYDYVILQEKSSGFSESLLRQGVEAFYPWIEEAPNHPQLLLYMPWANEDILKSGQTNVTNAYVAVAKDYGAKLAAAGEAYYELYFDKNKKWYRKGDNVHGNDLASLISASTIYYTITGRDSAFNFSAEDKEVLASLVESDDYRNNKVAYDAATVNLIEETALKYAGIYKDLTNVPDLEGRGMDGNTNLAKGKQGSASSNGRGSTRGIGARNVGNLTDGSYTSFLVSHEEDPDIWYAVDFGKSTMTDEVILYFGGTGTYVNTEKCVFTVEVSDEYESGYRVVASGESLSTDPIDLKYEAAEGRYLRVHVSSFSGTYVSMFEIEAYYQRPEEEPGEGGEVVDPGTEEPGTEEPGSEDKEPQPEPQEPEEVVVKAFAGDHLQVRVGERISDMALYDGNMYEATALLTAGDNKLEILANGEAIAERSCSISASSEEVIIRYFADKDKIVTGKDVHYDVNGNPVQDIKKKANWTGNFFSRTGIEEFKEFGGWDQNNALSRLDYIGGGVFKRTFTYTVPETAVPYQFKINFDGVWSNGEVPSENANVTFPASDKETDTFVLFVNSVTGEWFDSINAAPVSYKLADGSTYEAEAGKAMVTASIGDETVNMVQTSINSYRMTDCLSAGNYDVDIYVDGKLTESQNVSMATTGALTIVYDANKGTELIRKETAPGEETGSGDEGTGDNKEGGSSDAGNVRGPGGGSQVSAGQTSPAQGTAAPAALAASVGGVSATNSSSAVLASNRKATAGRSAVSTASNKTKAATADDEVTKEAEEVTEDNETEEDLLAEAGEPSEESAATEETEEEPVEGAVEETKEEEVTITDAKTALAADTDDGNNGGAPAGLILTLVAAGLAAAGGAGFYFIKKLRG